LISEAKGEYLLFTDADTKVGKSWISTLVNALQSGYGVVTGVSVIRGKHVFERFQNLDWIQAQAMVKIIEDTDTRVTSLGNNMGVSRKAYDAVGGFEGVPFSITEDFELYSSIIAKGFKAVHVYLEGALAETLAMNSIGALLEQRKRWMFGVVRLPNSIIIFLLLNTIYIPLVLFLSFINPLAGVSVGILRWLILSIFLKRTQKLIDQKGSIFWLLPFEIYQLFINLTSLVYYLLPIKARWKGRSFS
jgi:cellulose synthase/poly-beta-1,6-N-acetylglucosamine synthase-like glycosyltransferase